MSELITVKVPDIGNYKDIPVIDVCVKAGDTVKAEDALLTVESEKATMDIPSPVAGVVKEIKVKVVTRDVATIEEISQIKSALVGGRLEFINVRSSDIEYTKNLQVEAVFENKMARLIKGDRSYVTDECERILKGRLVPFPSNERLLVDAVEKLKNQVKNIIKDKVN